MLQTQALASLAAEDSGEPLPATRLLGLGATLGPTDCPGPDCGEPVASRAPRPTDCIEARFRRLERNPKAAFRGRPGFFSDPTVTTPRRYCPAPFIAPKSATTRPRFVWRAPVLETRVFDIQRPLPFRAFGGRPKSDGGSGCHSSIRTFARDVMSASMQTSIVSADPISHTLIRKILGRPLPTEVTHSM